MDPADGIPTPVESMVFCRRERRFGHTHLFLFILFSFSLFLFVYQDFLNSLKPDLLFKIPYTFISGKKSILLKIKIMTVHVLPRKLKKMSFCLNMQVFYLLLIKLSSG